MMIYRLLALLLSTPALRAAIWWLAKRRPYLHIETDGSLYMGRWWLFNPYDRPGHWAWLPSIRLHHICRPDQDRHLHDHPWDARTFILNGWYIELRQSGELATRMRGTTATLKHGEFHRIAVVSSGGVWTLFVTWRKRGTWGFLVNGHKVPYREYLG